MTSATTTPAGSLTAADLGRHIQVGVTHGVLTSVRHYSISSGPAAGIHASLIVQVATADPREPSHREIRVEPTVTVDLGPQAVGQRPELAQRTGGKR
ncbi:hypothetical protein [Kribbella sp. NPDC055071]